MQPVTNSAEITFSDSANSGHKWIMKTGAKRKRKPGTNLTLSRDVKRYGRELAKHFGRSFSKQVEQLIKEAHQETFAPTETAVAA